MKGVNGEDGFWKVEDKAGNSTWTFGIPNKPSFIPGAKAWVNGGLAGFYPYNDESYVNSPCFDLTAFTKPVISMNYWDDTEAGQDGAVLQYSVGLSGSGVQQWYNVGALILESIGMTTKSFHEATQGGKALLPGHMMLPT